MYDNKSKLENVRFASALGGSLDVYAGVAERAPDFYIKHNLEWLYRLKKNPSRAGRMMKLPKFIAGTVIRGNKKVK
ncbi:MAG: WecB/TagA/CpsF family glycosyltransferase [Clostridia bacterium]|nr:WecB/TagA/CpsF family glycosyltransferase [Clostridia bacterium]